MFSMGERPAVVKGGRPAGPPHEATAGATARAGLAALPHGPIHVRATKDWRAATPSRTGTRTWSDGTRPLPPLSRSLPLLVQRHGQDQETVLARTTLYPEALTDALIAPARSHLHSQPRGLRRRGRTTSSGGGWMTVTERLLSGVPGPADAQAWRSMFGQTQTLFHVKLSTHAVSLRRMGRSGRWNRCGCG